MIHDLVTKSRSYRRFYQEEPVTRETLVSLVDLARLSPSSANKQPLRFILSCELEKNALIFSHLAWAGYLKNWDGPEEGERPAAYIIVLGDLETSKAFSCDHGIVSQSMLLGAVEQGLGGCMIASVQRHKLAQALNLAERYEILLVLALGKPKETVRIDDLAPGGDVEYWRDEQAVHHVPKRTLDELILE